LQGDALGTADKIMTAGSGTTQEVTNIAKGVMGVLSNAIGAVVKPTAGSTNSSRANSTEATQV